MNKIDEKLLDNVLGDSELSDDELSHILNDEELSTWMKNIETSLDHAEFFAGDENDTIHQVLLDEEKRSIKHKQLKSTLGFVAVAILILGSIATYGINYGFDLVIAGQIIITLMVPWIIVFFAIAERRRTNV